VRFRERHSSSPSVEVFEKRTVLILTFVFNKINLMSKIIKILFILFTPILLPAQNIIPTPKEIIQKKNYLAFDKGVRISEKSVSANNSKLINDILKDQIDISNRKGKRLFIHLEKIASSEQINEKLKKYNLNSNYKLGKEGYILNIDLNKIEVFALSDAGIFYGIQTLRQLFNNYSEEKKIPCMVIYDKPDIPVRGWQDDISRGPIPTMETLKKEIEIMSSFKMNYFTLYTEHVFKLDKHPTIAPKDGITQAEILELSAFAKKYHVTLIGNYQSFAHMYKTLANPKYAHLGENRDVISPAKEETYEFLSDVYEEIVPPYDGKYFNINCDETFGLGDGKSKAIIDSIGIEGLYAYHINRLDEVLKKYDKQILMWGDVAITHPEIIPALPKDMTVMAWGYSPEESFNHVIEPIVKQKLDFWVAPGVSCWQHVYPDLTSSEKNIYNFIRDGYKFDTKGVLNTSWDDDALNFFNNNWQGFIWGAELSWSAPPYLLNHESDVVRKRRYQKFNAAFDKQFYGLNNADSITSLMHEFSLLHYAPDQDILKNESLFEDVFPIPPNYVKEGSKEKNGLVLERLSTMLVKLKQYKDHSKQNAETINYLVYSVNQARVITEKNLFRIQLHEYLYKKTTSTEKELLASKEKLVTDLKKLKADYIKLWNKENRKHWLAENIVKFDALIEGTEDLGSTVLIEPIMNKEETKVSMRTVIQGYPIYYSLDKDTTTTSSTLYTKPLSIKRAAVVKVFAYDEKQRKAVKLTSFLYHKAIGRLHHLASTPSSYHPSYYAGGKHALVDGKIGEKEDLWSGKWQGYSGQDIEVELVFNPNEELKSFSMGFFQYTDLWVIFPPQVEIYVKDNLEDEYKLYRIIKGTVSAKEKGGLKEHYSTGLGNLKTKYMKVVAKYYGKLPEWHKAGGADYESMLFADEIIIK
jgi:hypothetical protein